MNITDIKNRLQEHFINDKIEVFDSRGTGDHFSLIIISNTFSNVSLVDRHRMIYSLFKQELTHSIHALQIQTFTINEWKNKKSSK